MRSVLLEYESECSVFSTQRNIQGTESATRLPTPTIVPCCRARRLFRRR